MVPEELRKYLDDSFLGSEVGDMITKDAFVEWCMNALVEEEHFHDENYSLTVLWWEY